MLIGLIPFHQAVHQHSNCFKSPYSPVSGAGGDKPRAEKDEGGKLKGPKGVIFLQTSSISLQVSSSPPRPCRRSQRNCSFLISKNQQSTISPISHLHSSLSAPFAALRLCARIFFAGGFRKPFTLLITPGFYAKPSLNLVEVRGVEPLAFSLRTRRSTN